MQTITKRDLIDRVVDRTNARRSDVRDIIQAALDVMTTEIIEGHRIEFRDFGVFEVKQRAERMAQNPKTLQRVRIPPKRTVRFKAGRLMRSGLKTAAEGAPAELNGTLPRAAED